MGPADETDGWADKCEALAAEVQKLDDMLEEQVVAGWRLACQVQAQRELGEQCIREKDGLAAQLKELQEKADERWAVAVATADSLRAEVQRLRDGAPGMEDGSL
jgi:uncharacterized coiled-coil DUF342 family protein